jgi:hypothetical protein
MRKTTMKAWLLALSIVIACGPLRAQEGNKPASETDKPKVDHPVKPGQAYRVDFAISEMADGKKINTRHYSMLLNSGPWGQIKIGTRVPVTSGVGTYQYLDVGTNIDCEVGEEGDDISLDVRTDFSNLSSPEDQRNPQPVIRQVKINARTLVTPGKSAVLGSVDDPSSNRQFQLEAVATKLK